MMSNMHMVHQCQGPIFSSALAGLVFASAGSNHGFPWVCAARVVFNVSLRFPMFQLVSTYPILFVSLPLRIVLGLIVVVEWRCWFAREKQCPNTFACKFGGLKPSETHDPCHDSRLRGHDSTTLGIAGFHSVRWHWVTAILWPSTSQFALLVKNSPSPRLHRWDIL